MEEGTYEFDAEGRMVMETEEPDPTPTPDPEVKNGLVEENGNTYYYVDGVLQIRAGLVEIDGYYYYFNSNNTAVKNCTYWVSKANGLMEEGSYKFDAAGRMILG